MKRFQNKPYLDKGDEHQLANLLNISKKRIETWFIERRREGRQAGLLALCEEYLTKTDTRTHTHDHACTRSFIKHTNGEIRKNKLF